MATLVKLTITVGYMMQKSMCYEPSVVEPLNLLMGSVEFVGMQPKYPVDVVSCDYNDNMCHVLQLNVNTVPYC